MNFLEALPPHIPYQSLANIGDFNVLTGLPRKRERRRVNHKRRATHACNVTEKNMTLEARLRALSYAKQRSALMMMLVALRLRLQQQPHLRQEILCRRRFVELYIIFVTLKKWKLLQLDSAIMDIHNPEPAYHIPSNYYRRLDVFQNDDHCENFTNFTRSEIVAMMNWFEMDDWIYVDRGGNQGRLRFNCEEMILFSLYKMKHGHSTVDICKVFGGNDAAWGHAYKWFVRNCLRLYGDRVTVGGAYGHVKKKWRLLVAVNEEKFKLERDSTFVGAQIQAVFLLHNIHVCIRGRASTAMNRGFGIAGPSVEDYLGL